MQIRRISLALAATDIGVTHEAIAVFTCGDLVKLSDAYLQLQLNCAGAMGKSYRRLSDALDEADAFEFGATLGAVFVSEPKNSVDARVYVVGLGESSLSFDSTSAGDYQMAVQKLFETLIASEFRPERLTVVLPSTALYGAIRSEVARCTAMWAVLALAGPFDTKYGESRQRAKHDLDLLFLVEETCEAMSEISAKVGEGARRGYALLAHRNELLDPALIELTPLDEAEPG